MPALRPALAATLMAAALLADPVAIAQVSSGGKTLRGTDIRFGQNPALPVGVEAVVLYGDPATGAFVTRVRLEAGARIMPHSHAMENVLTVLSGTLHYAEGAKWDAALLQAYPAGSFIVETARVPHFMAALDTPVVFQVSVPAKSSFDYVDPADDPRKK